MAEIKQLNMNDPRVAKWYDDAAEHSDSGKCRNDDTCPGCVKLMRRNRELHAIPGLEVAVSV